MGAWRVALSSEAESDLEQLTAFLARKSPTAAARVGLELVEVDFLARFAAGARCTDA